VLWGLAGDVILGITGRIASGKSTLSPAVVAELERRGRSAQAIDLDVVARDEAGSWRVRCR
jgi:dephospho-CoA kinase